jgi:peptide/nickel transport system substrate-binding protein
LSRSKLIAGALALVAILVVALFLLLRGDGDDPSGRVSTTAVTGATPERAFPELKVAMDNGIDYLDPGLAYTVQGWSIMFPVHLGLLSYRHVSGPEGATLIPALAEALPAISADRRRYRFTLREGLRYSNAAPVLASDFASTIERLFRIKSPGAGFFTGIEGAARFAETGQGDISGIVVDDQERSIEITLLEPQGDFLYRLATMFASLVPAGTDDTDQSTERIPATGPYMVETYSPSEQATLVRNPEWEGIDGIPDGNPDKMTFTVIDDPSEALDSVLEGDNDYDFHQVPRDRLAEIRREHADRLRLYVPANVYYYFMNTREPPFDRLEVRQAVNHAVDRQEIVRLYRGLAKPTQNVLPPTYPQYEEIDLYDHDLQKARALVRESGHEGASVTVWGNSRDTIRGPAEYLVEVLNQIGFEAKVKIVDPALYLTMIGDRRTRAQTGVANWFLQDYPHPLSWFEPLVSGSRITERGNGNFSNANVPEIDAKIEELADEELSDDVNAEWAEVDRLVVENALWAPLVNRQFADFFASDVDLESCYVNHVLYQFLYATACKDD